MSDFESAFIQSLAATKIPDATSEPSPSYSPIVDDSRPLAQQAAEYHQRQEPVAAAPMPMPVFNPPPRPKDPMIYIVPIGVALALVFAYFALKKQ